MNQNIITLMLFWIFEGYPVRVHYSNICSYSSLSPCNLDVLGSFPSLFLGAYDFLRNAIEVKQDFCGMWIFVVLVVVMRMRMGLYRVILLWVNGKLKVLWWENNGG